MTTKCTFNIAKFAHKNLFTYFLKILLNVYLTNYALFSANSLNPKGPYRKNVITCD